MMLLEIYLYRHFGHVHPCLTPDTLPPVSLSHHPIMFPCNCPCFLDVDSKFTSFQRQLNLYQFKRRKGAHAGAFHHPSFRRGQRHLLSKVRRQKVKRDLAVEARAAQRLARSKDSHHGHRSSEHSGRGRTRAAAQADLRPIQQREDDGDMSDDEFGPGSRRSALRRRVDSGPTTRGIGETYNEGDESSNDGAWSIERNSMERFSSGDERDWGGNWRQQVPGSPERTPVQLHHVSTPMTSQSSEYEHSPGSSIDRTSSIGSSMGSAVSFSSSSPTHSEIHSEMFHSSPYHFDDERSVSSQNSPMSIHSPVEQAVAAVQAAQVSPPDNDLSLAAVVDASMGWNSPPNSSSLPHFEAFGWGSAASETVAPWSDQTATEIPAASTSAPHHHAHTTHQEDFGFIDLFAANWDPNAGPSSVGSSMESELPADGRTDVFMKEAQAAGMFGVEDFLSPRGGAGGYGGPGDYA